jgi:hypothetical protein
MGKCEKYALEVWAIWEICKNYVKKYAIYVYKAMVAEICKKNICKYVT